MDFETEKIWNKYIKPVADSLLKDVLNQITHIDPHFDMEDYFKKSKQLMIDFKQKYPDMKYEQI